METTHELEKLEDGSEFLVIIICFRQIHTEVKLEFRVATSIGHLGTQTLISPNQENIFTL